MNIKLSEKILTTFASQGVGEYVVCPGARNSPLVKVLSQATGCQVHYFYDERAAAFFALGRAKQSGQPVAVVTTSGTAVAELLPATVEAHYSGVPLVLLTADRPKNFRGAGAPQSIEHVGIFSHYVFGTYDFDFTAADQIAGLNINLQAPTHVNVCFAEPLIDSQVVGINLQPETSSKGPCEAATVAGTAALNEFFQKVQRPLVILAEIPRQYRAQTLEFLLNLKAPIYAEAASGLREAPALQDFLLPVNDNFLQQLFISGENNCDGVLRIGGVPTTRLWRDLENRFVEIPVVSVSHQEFSGLARVRDSALTFSDLLSTKFRTREPIKDIFVSARKAQEKLSADLQTHADSEPAYMRQLSDYIPAGALVMLGNSLPIRLWDLSATTKDKNFSMVVQRGANGIDGLVATFIGLAEKQRENWLILGDLSALYDLNSLSLVRKDVQLRVVVINNGGGYIFKSMFNDESFLNKHSLEFSHWAAMFGWSYVKIESPKDLSNMQLKADANYVVEVRPNNLATEVVRGAL